MKRTELERAWPAAEPPPGFSERVMERLQLGAVLPDSGLPDAALRSEPVPRRACALSWWNVQRVRWLALPAAALVLGGALLLGGRGLLWPAGPAREGDVIAAEPRVVSIGERAVAEMSSGAHVHWSGEEEVQQDSGAVTYRVLPGGSFRVQTPHGSVTALGTVFRVVVADHEEEARGDAMKKRWAIGGASAALGALLWVSVDRGSVRLSNDTEELVLSAGQAGAMGSEGLRLESAAPSALPDAGGVAAKNAERARLRQVADAVRRHAAQQRAVTLAAKQAAAKRSALGQEPSEPTTPPVEYVFRGSDKERPPETAEGKERREYLNRAIHEQYFPVARDCYAELLERKPTAEGKVVLEFAIVGDGDAGVVDRVELRDDKDTIEDPEFLLCMTESMYAAVFQPPPPGAKETTVVYPIMLSPQ